MRADDWPRARAIPLEVWQDPQGDVVMTFDSAVCRVFFGCWTDSGDDPADYLAETFEHALSTVLAHSRLE